MLERFIPLFRNPTMLKSMLDRMRPVSQKIDLQHYRHRKGKHKNQALLEARRKRIMDTISLKEPDRVPVIGGGVNFFPAKYAGITVAEFMYDLPKMRNAYIKMNTDFPLDMTFPSFLLALGRPMTAAGLNLLKIPGRDIDVNACYQYNEVDRLKDDEYTTIIQRGMPFVVDTIAPRVAELFGKHGIGRLAGETRVMLELMKFVGTATGIMHEMEARGIYSFFGAFAFPPYDVMSLMFRTLSSLTRDLMKKQTRDQVMQLCERMNPLLINLYTSMAKATGLPGVFFPSERAFSLSPRQFEQFYWPTLKQMILALVKEGLIPFLEWEADVTHLVHFLKEDLPKNVARKCVFNCDASDIFEVHKILDGHMAITGNIPLSTMCVGTPHDVEQYCAKLFETLKPGGGYLLCPALGIPDEAKPENVHAMIRYAHEHGKY
nr:uroporphyrinogen decarboxylase family protein [Candidatus Sigynarchaeota archaeon]